ncbi:DUF6229 family protein [Actinophytocola sp.]|jgi:hypothetical protein
MSTLEMIRAEEIIAAWRAGESDVDSPAGPLCTGGRKDTG